MKKFHKPPSLRRTLTRQMIWMQTLVLLVFTLMAAVPILRLVSSEQGLDAGVINDIAESVGRSAGGGLALTPSGRLSKIVEAYPGFWFYAVDIDGHPVQLGIVPEQIRGLEANLTRINSANISDVGTPETPVAIIRQHQSDAGRLWIITAGGR